MPTFLLFCHRFFELRFMIVSGLLDELAAKGRLSVMMPEDLAEGMKAFLPKNVDVHVGNYAKHITKRQKFILNFLGDVLYLTFPHTNILPNATAQFHRDHYITRNAFGKFVVVQLSNAASAFKWFRRFLVWIYQKNLPTNAHKALINTLKPDAMIGCSFGMGYEDAAFLAEARENDVLSVTAVQSWDRTSNKGYPTVHPDHALVWNDIMKKECEVLLEFAPEAVHITGSPLWDEHFNKLKKPRDPSWRSGLNIPEDKKIIFFSCGGFGSHSANMEVIPKVFDLAQKEFFKDKAHIIFRMYPQYQSPVTKQGPGKQKKDEIEALLNQYQDIENISILYPEVTFDGKNFFPTAEDHVFMTECLRQCDVSLSQVSSQMIEACIFGKPAINIEFGKRVTDKYNLEIRDYKTEHLLRLYRTEAIYRVQYPEDLENTIMRALEAPEEKQSQRDILVKQEAPVNQGTASHATADLIANLALRKKD